MARVLIVGCGCRGRELARSLLADGHAVRGTTRRREALAEIEAAGAEPALADPDRLATLLPHLEQVGVLCWLMGSARGDRDAVAALHGPRLASIGETLVDTHVRGLVYEGAVDPDLRAGGEAIASRLGEANRMPVELLDADPSDPVAWTAAARAAVGRVLAA